MHTHKQANKHTHMHTHTRYGRNHSPAGSLNYIPAQPKTARLLFFKQILTKYTENTSIQKNNVESDILISHK